jgi:hypothetical protein
MNLLGKITCYYLPTAIKKRNLNQLIRLTARAFQSEPPDTNGKSYQECLQKFAYFTQKKASEIIVRKDNMPKVKKRLYRNAFLMGYNIRKLLGIHTQSEVMAISRRLYGFLNIDFQGDSSGQITIKKCFFSSYYSKEICQLISALDEGIVAGLSAGGKLSFNQRITEGKPCCQGQLIMPEV